MSTPRRSSDRWAALKHDVKRRWSRLTDEDVDAVQGNVERLVDALRIRHGYDRAVAMREITAWSQSLAAAGHAPRP